MCAREVDAASASVVTAVALDGVVTFGVLAESSAMTLTW